MTEETSSPKGPRWWPLLVITGLVLAFLGLTWFGGAADNRQQLITGTLSATALWLLLVLVWLTFFSRLRWWWRASVWGVLGLSTGVFFSQYRFAGVSGDLVPLFVPRTEKLRDIVEGIDAEHPEATSPFPQFLGPSRDGRLSDMRLRTDWEQSPPRLLWRRPVGSGWSGFAIRDGRAVTVEQHHEFERVVCYSLENGSILWSHDDKASYTSGLAGDGPRSTPCFDGESVFTTGATGILNAFDVQSGERLWSRNVLEDEGAPIPEWGYASSPLVVAGKVVVPSGGDEGALLVAMNVADGTIAWRSGCDRIGYSSPTKFRLFGEDHLVMLGAKSMSACRPEDGDVLWLHTWESAQPNIAQPQLIGDDRLLVSAGYGVGSTMFKILKDEDGTYRTEILWRSRRLKSKFANLIAYGDHVYGLDDGTLVCIDVETGSRVWKAGRYGHGQVLLVDDVLVVQTESGEIVAVNPTPDGHQEMGRFRVLTGNIWNPPALAGSRLLIRNDREAALFELPIHEN